MPDKLTAKPAAGIGRYALMLLVTIVCGVLFAALCGWLFAEIITVDDIGFARLGNFLLGGIVGYALGLVFGVWLAARLLHRPGRLWRASIGAAVGVALVLLLAEPLSLNTNQGLLMGLLLVIPALLAVVWHQMRLTRRG